MVSNEIKLQLEAGIKLDEIEVKLTLTTLKLLHSTRIIEFYSKMTSHEGSQSYRMVTKVMILKML